MNEIIKEYEIDAKLCQWQEQDSPALMPDISTQALFSQWAEEDTHMTDEEREAEDLLWVDIENGLSENSGMLRLRRLP